MANQDVTTLPGAYPDSLTLVTATSLDTTDGNVFTLTGGELVRIENTADSGDASVTLSSVDSDKTKRQEDITETVSPGEAYIYGPTERDGWRDSNGELKIDGDSADVEIEVYQN